jgi:hypothetical protein
MHTTSTFFCLTLLSINISLAQRDQDAQHASDTKMEAFASRTGTITKFIDFKLSSLKLFLGEPAQTRIRKIVSGDESMYFYLLEKQGKTDINSASIEYDDLLEAIKALSTLKGEAVKDVYSKPDYVENKFITDDGFQFGYYVTEGKSKWYLKFEQSGSDNTFFINDAQTIENSFNEAKKKIEEIKSESARNPLIAKE